MRRIIVFTLMALTLAGGTALADRDHRRVDRRGDRGGVTIRNPRDPVWHQRDRRVQHPRDRRVYHRSPVRVRDGYFHFHNGYRYRYVRPVIRQRYFNYRVRPQIIVENYQPVAGYIWIPGQWQWNGYEWIWISGHYEVDPNIRY